MCIQMGGTCDHHHATALCGDTEPLNSTDWSHEEGRHKDNSEERGAGEGGKGDFRVRNNLLQQNWVICRDEDGPRDLKQSEVSQKEKNKSCIIALICGI